MSLLKKNVMCLSRFLSVVLCVLFAAGTALGSDDSAYLTKTEFEAFIQQYHENHQAKAAKKSAFYKGKFGFTPYGYFNLDASFESDKTTTGDYTVWANAPGKKEDPGFSADVKSTRLGMKIDGPGISGWNGSKTEAVVEVDFQQGYHTSRNRAGLLLRKAYLAVYDNDTRFLAGQDWEVISPLYPKLLNYTGGAGVGNIGYRRGMLRVDQKWTEHWATQFALCDNVYRDGTAVSPASARYPLIEGRVAYTFSPAHPRMQPIKLGLSGHIGEQRYTFAGIGNTKYLKTWSFNVDLDLPITQKLTFQTEYFLGENLGMMEVSAVQGVDWYRQNTIRAQGGWAALTYQATKKLQSNVGYMIDDPFNGDIVTASTESGGTFRSRNYNHVIFANVMYNWSEALMTGFEINLWRTHWQQADSSGVVESLGVGESQRYQFTVRYSF
ncbi:MAG: hypothetical protein LBT89_10835 [Planctomycetaceae bacterium]|jgi:hypothetical protein|nr:hypothetical protein [Planctomycetaceae bacterium]